MAVVLTHDAPQALDDCLRAIRGQLVPPAEVLVVDNGGLHPAGEVVEALGPGTVPISVLRLPDNPGPAGGHAAGLEQFLGSRQDLAWVFDDDCIPEPACLAELLAEAARHRGPAVVFPLQADRGGAVQNYPAWFGVLLPREVIRTVGVPLRALFWWTEDTEYLQWRIPRAGFPVLRAPQARVVHHGVRQTARKPAWKYYYETRNSVYYRLHVQRCRRAHKLAPYFVRTILRVLVREDQRGRKLTLVGLGACHGVVGRLGKSIPVTTHAAVRNLT